MRYFHGSYTNLPVGFELKGRGNAYEEAWSHTDFYAVLEKHRPSHMLPHKNAVFMCDDIEDIDLAGGATDFIFELKPLSSVSKHDLNWSSEISCLISEGYAINSNQVIHAAKNYWEGIAHPNESVWEYLTEKAIIIAKHVF